MAQPFDGMKVRRGATLDGLHQAGLVVGREQQVLARVAQVRVHEQRWPVELRERDRELRGQLRSTVAGTRAQQGDDVGSIAGLAPEQQLGSQSANLFATRVERVVGARQLWCRLGESHNLRYHTRWRLRPLRIVLAPCLSVELGIHAKLLFIGMAPNSASTGTPLSRSRSSRQRTRRFVSS